ncbi:HAD family hydrolase [Bacillus sp. BHET2]|uniref:HAD hydrolase-like protein n=1 Tax=Bacillus sp. BHET2 TaxID=2583818 RepID=UPI00110F3A7F|nr:HAD hydrolase-like protein [Bacillus sp. BHET2]TMU87630.1 HAD family hydrolase [Bacillus sp. BHET2]
MKAAIIFDMDGTIFQTNRILEASLRDAFHYLRDEGLWKGRTPIETYREMMGAPLSVVWSTLLPDHSIQVRRQMNDVFHEQLIGNIQKGNGALYPNTEKLLGYLSDRGFPIFVASNGYPHYLQAIVESHSLGEWISTCYSIQEIQSEDKADLIRQIKEDHNLSHGIVVGDRLSDFKGAEANHFLSIGCAFDFSQDKELLQADIVVDDLIEIKEYMEKLATE